MVSSRLTTPHVLAIDTNILLVLLGYTCLRKASTLERERKLREVRGRDEPVSGKQFDDLWELFSRAGRRIVTQHVVAEVYGLRKRLRFRKEVVWENAERLLWEHGLEERACCIRDLLLRPEFRRILEAVGPADAGLLHTAEVEKATLLTEDGQLSHFAHERSVPVLSLSRIPSAPTLR
jgi:rRNA-processing protein FCF1